MPDCFQLISKVTQEPTSLHQIDEEVCKVLNVEPHNRRYGGSGENAWDWFNTIGYDLSQRRTFPEIRERYSSDEFYAEYLPRILKIIDYLEESYTPHAFFSRH